MKREPVLGLPVLQWTDISEGFGKGREVPSHYALHKQALTSWMKTTGGADFIRVGHFSIPLSPQQLTPWYQNTTEQLQISVRSQLSLLVDLNDSDSPASGLSFDLQRLGEIPTFILHFSEPSATAAQTPQRQHPSPSRHSPHPAAGTKADSFRGHVPSSPFGMAAWEGMQRLLAYSPPAVKDRVQGGSRKTKIPFHPGRRISVAPHSR